MKGLAVRESRRYLRVGIVLAGCLAAVTQVLVAQAPANDGGQGAGAQAGQKQAAPQKQESNPFPEDTSTVPVMPTTLTPAVPEATSGGSAAPPALPSEETDPVKSPDDPIPSEGAIDERESSSSLSGMDKILNPPDDETRGKRGKKAEAPEHQETSAEDIDVGKYYLERKNWRAALSRFQSALVLAPDEPEVYWGLAESERNLGHFAEARGYYQKVLDYDPDSKHGKEARKALKEPEIANAKAGVAPGAEPGK